MQTVYKMKCQNKERKECARQIVWNKHERTRHKGGNGTKRIAIDHKERGRRGIGVYWIPLSFIPNAGDENGKNGSSISPSVSHSPNKLDQF